MTPDNHPKQNNPGFLEIYLTFFKISAMTFGGGYAMLPFLERYAVEQKNWCSKEEMLDNYAVAQSLPGIIAINVAVITATKLRGAGGALCAALGVISPCLIIIVVIAALLNGFRDNEYVQHALSGICVCVAALIVNSVIKLWKSGIKEAVQLAIFGVTLILALVLDISSIFYVIGGIAAGLIIGLVLGRKSS